MLRAFAGLCLCSALVLQCIGCQVSGGPSVYTQEHPPLAAGIGMKESRKARDLVERAVQDVNSLIAPYVDFRLWADWTPKPDDGIEQVPVLLVAGRSGFGPCYVPSGERLIVVEDELVGELPIVLSNGVTNGLALDTQRMLTVSLLHESGHVKYRHAGKVVGGNDQHNALDTDQKAKEWEADEFAASCLKAAAALDWTARRRIIEMGISTDLVALNFNLGVGQLVNQPLGEEVFHPERIYLDSDYTHANIQLRFMYIENTVHPTAEGDAAINSFRKKRDDAAGKLPSYRLIPEQQ